MSPPPTPDFRVTADLTMDSRDDLHGIFAVSCKDNSLAIRHEATKFRTTFDLTKYDVILDSPNKRLNFTQRDGPKITMKIHIDTYFLQQILGRLFPHFCSGHEFEYVAPEGEERSFEAAVSRTGISDGHFKDRHFIYRNDAEKFYLAFMKKRKVLPDSVQTITLHDYSMRYDSRPQAAQLTFSRSWTENHMFGGQKIKEDIVSIKMPDATARPMLIRLFSHWMSANGFEYKLDAPLQPPLPVPAQDDDSLQSI